MAKNVTSLEELNAMMRSLMKSTMERMLNTETDVHLGRLAREAKQEKFWIVTLNTKNQPIDCHQITVGTLRNSLVHPREVFRPAIGDAANCILVLHNHPSGDPSPSDQDLSVTERLEQTAEVVGIPVIDHIIVAGEKAVSIREWRSENRWEVRRASLTSEVNSQKTQINRQRVGA